MAQPTGYVTLYDADGQVITSLELDATGIATYQKTLTAEDIGRDTYRAVYTGDNTYAPNGEDTFTIEVVDENGNGGTKSKATHVIKIVAGPGIYISPNNGQGTVTISTRPLGSNNNDLYVVRYTQTISTKYNDQACFLAGGADGVLITSTDGQDWTDTGPVNSLGLSGTALNFYNLANIESADQPDDGLVYWYTNNWVYEETPTKIEGISTSWGRQGYTTDSGIYKGDNIDKSGAK